MPIPSGWSAPPTGGWCWWSRPGSPGPSDISDTLETIEVSPAPLLGIVLTRVDPSDPIPWHHLAAQPEPIGQA